jgi:hypothetical protein
MFDQALIIQENVICFIFLSVQEHVCQLVYRGPVFCSVF